MAPASCTLAYRVLLVLLGPLLNIKFFMHDFIMGGTERVLLLITSLHAYFPAAAVLIGSCSSLDRFIRVPWHVPNRLPVSPPVVKPPGSSWPPKRPGRVRRLQVESRSPTDTGERHVVYICMHV